MITQILASLAAHDVLVLFVVALLTTCHGFVNPLSFITTGYSFSMVTQAVVTLTLHRGSCSSFATLHALLNVAYGLRIGIFLVWRDSQETFRQQMAPVKDSTKRLGIVVKFFMWISVSALYLAMFYPALISCRANDKALSVTQTVGAAVMAGGIMMESVADAQKSASKKRAPGRFCDTGLYRWVRCPNYFAEIVVWVGNFVAGTSTYNDRIEWGVSAVGLAAIICVMRYDGTPRIERKQWKAYGKLPEYQKYASEVPVLFPLVPVYSVLSEDEREKLIAGGENAKTKEKAS